jgi:hypothetical protein
VDTFTVVFDACVLYPNDLRDLLLELANQRVFLARWTEQIHDEWTRHLKANRPDIDPKKIDYVRQLMNESVPNCLVAGYEPLISGLSLPDPNDRHVLAAAIVAKAGAIVTLNAKHFPQAALAPYGIEAQHPDDFLVYQFDLAPGAVCEAVRRLRKRLKRPPMDVEEYLQFLTKHQLPGFVGRLRSLEGVI